MPSSKKERGRQRREKREAKTKADLSLPTSIASATATASTFADVGLPSEETGCLHGSSRNKVVVEMCEELENDFRNPSDLCTVLFRYPGVLKSKGSWRTVLTTLAARAVASILKFEDKGRIPPTYIVKVRNALSIVMIFEMVEKQFMQKDFMNVLVKNFPRLLERSRIMSESECGVMVRFLAKRVPCSCLDCLKTKARSASKMGRCYGCQKTMEYKTMYVCSACKFAHYCSKKCQVEAWKTHKKECGMTKKLLDFDLSGAMMSADFTKLLLES
jgi:MYND finger